jgi:hypothetical protein
MFGERQSGFVVSRLCLLVFLFCASSAAFAQIGDAGHKGPTRTLSFPDDMSIGKVSLLKKNSSVAEFDASTRSTSAQGKVLAPIGQPLMLEINYAGASHLDKLANIPTDAFVYLKMEKLPLDDAAIAKLSNRFTHLKRLDLKRLEFSDAGLALLQPQSLKDLESLRCEFCSVKGPGLGTLARFKKLRILCAAFGEIEANELGSLEKLQNLQYLNLRDSRLTDTALMHIGKMPNLETLDIKGNPRITDAGLKGLINLRHLSYLNLTECYRVTADGIIQLKNLPLTSVEVSGRFEVTPGMTKEDLYKLQRAFPKTTFKAINKETPMYKEILDTLK